MSMYLPASFVESDLAALDMLVERDNFVTLITVRDGTPVVNHLPVLYERDGERIELRGHWARPNPQAKHAGAATIIIIAISRFIISQVRESQPRQSRAANPGQRHPRPCRRPGGPY